MKKISGKIGLGTLSLVLAIMGIFFSGSVKNGPCYGDIILNFIGLKPWSGNGKGTHYTVFYSLIFFIPAVILAYRHKKNIGAKVGGLIALLSIIIILVVITFFMPRGSFFD